MVILCLQRKKPLYFKRRILRICRWLAFCLIFLLVSPIFSQYRIENWSTEQGLPYKTVHSVLQTRDGYIWAATADGLARFDGVRFTVFNTANTPSLATNSFGTMVETDDGSLWVAAAKRGLIRYKGGGFTSYTTAHGLPGDEIWSLQYFPSENLLRVGTSAGFARFDGENFAPEDLPGLSKEFQSLTITDNTGAIWERSGNELRRADGKRAETFLIPKFFSRSLFNLLYRDRAGNLWLAFDDVLKGYVVRFQGNKADIFSNKDGLPGGIINFIFEDSKDNLWFASKGSGGLSLYRDGTFQRLTKDGELLNEGFYSFIEDREGGIWAGTLDSGLLRFSPQVIKSYSSKDGLSGKGVYPLYEDREGTIWIGDWGETKGLMKYQNGKFDAVGGGGLYTSLFQDKDGVLWFGSYNQIGKIAGGKYSIVYSLPQIATSAIAQDRSGAIWFGSGDGLRRMKSSPDDQTRSQVLIPNPAEQFDHFTVENGLPAADVTVLHFDREGALWIGTTGGLAKMSEPPVSDAAQTHPLKQAALTTYTEKEGLSGNHVRSIYEDSDGVLWIGTFDKGLTRLKDGNFTAVLVKDGLFDQGAFQILEDDFGRFWISSNRGIYRVAKQELNDFADGKIPHITSVAYGVKDGMADAECNGGRSPGGFKSKKDGTLWFPTQKGVVVVDPKTLPVAAEPPNVVIETCLLDGVEIACRDIKILPENYSLEIKYTGLSFNKPEQIKFKYRLEGLDQNWIDAGTRRRAFFTHLPPGDYTFRVTAGNVDGIWNETGTNLKITVKPPFYRTFWFLSLSVLACLGILFFIYSRRFKNLERQRVAQEEFSRKLLESQERDRQRIAAELHDSLGQDLLVIKNWASIGLRNPADAKTEKQFGEISETVSAAIDEVREIAYNLRPYQLDRLGLSKAIKSMLERVFDPSDINFTMQIDNTEGFFPKDAEIAFYRIVQEAVNNIVKHSGASEAGVSVRRIDDELRLLVWDNGKGFEQNLPASRRGGFGLTGISERARILGGKIEVNSTKDEGTTVSFSINSTRKNL